MIFFPCLLRPLEQLKCYQTLLDIEIFLFYSAEMIVIDPWRSPSGLRDATLARVTPDQKVACLNHVGVTRPTVPTNFYFRQLAKRIQDQSCTVHRFGMSTQSDAKTMVYKFNKALRYGHETSEICPRSAKQILDHTYLNSSSILPICSNKFIIPLVGGESSFPHCDYSARLFIVNSLFFVKRSKLHSALCPRTFTFHLLPAEESPRGAGVGRRGAENTCGPSHVHRGRVSLTAKRCGACSHPAHNLRIIRAA